MNLRHIRKQDLDAVHRLGVKKAGTTRGIIVRFVSRKTRDEVIANRRKLKKKDGKSVVIVEDLTKGNYHLCNVARDDPVVKLCWTVRGKIFVKAHSGKIIEIKLKADLQNPRLKDTASTSAGGDRRNKAENSAENSSATQATVRRSSVDDANSEDAMSEADAVTEGENPSDLWK